MNIPERSTKTSVCKTTGFIYSSQTYTLIWEKPYNVSTLLNQLMYHFYFNVFIILQQTVTA